MIPGGEESSKSQTNCVINPLPANIEWVKFVGFIKFTKSSHTVDIGSITAVGLPQTSIIIEVEAGHPFASVISKDKV